MKEHTIQTAMATDERYLNFALITFASLLHHRKEQNVELHLLHSGLSGKLLDQFHRLEKIAPFQFTPHHIEPALLRDWPAMRWSVSTYYRLLLQEIVPECEKMLYLDCDILVLDDIQSLWDTDISDFSCAAVSAKIGKNHWATLGLPSAASYFNAGIMLFRPAEMLRNNDLAAFRECYIQHKEHLKYPDQDILNIVYANRWKKLPLRWNLVTSVYRNPPDPQLYTEEESRDALRNPGIAHFTGTHKPWLVSKTYHHPYARPYRLFAELAGMPSKMIFSLRLKECLHPFLAKPRMEVPWDASILKKITL